MPGYSGQAELNLRLAPDAFPRPLPIADFRFAPAAASPGHAGPATPGLRRVLPVQIIPAIQTYRSLCKFSSSSAACEQLPVRTGCHPSAARCVSLPACASRSTLRPDLYSASGFRLPQNPRLDWWPDVRPSPKINLQLACVSADGLRRLCLALASPVFAASGLRRLPQSPAKLATIP